MDRLLQLGGDKKFLSYDDLNRELPENVVSPDDIEDVLPNWTLRIFTSLIRKTKF